MATRSLYFGAQSQTGNRNNLEARESQLFHSNRSYVRRFLADVMGFDRGLVASNG